MAELINKELYVDEAVVDNEYHSDRLAEYLERAIYYCPKCNSLSTFESHGDEIECKKCGLKAKYLPTKEIVGLNYDLPYHFVADWYQAQLDFVNSLDLSTFENNPIYCEKGEFYEVIVYKNKYQISNNIEILLFADKIKVKDENFSMEFPFDEIKTITVCGKNKLNIYFGNKLYQITGGERFNALKYMNLVFRYRNIKKSEKGEEYEQFLGL
jgi:ribosomal protein S27AE